MPDGGRGGEQIVVGGRVEHLLVLAGGAGERVGVATGERLQRCRHRLEAHAAAQGEAVPRVQQAVRPLHHRDVDRRIREVDGRAVGQAQHVLEVGEHGEVVAVGPAPRVLARARGLLHSLARERPRIHRAEVLRDERLVGGALLQVADHVVVERIGPSGRVAGQDEVGQARADGEQCRRVAVGRAVGAELGDVLEQLLGGSASIEVDAQRAPEVGVGGELGLEGGIHVGELLVDGDLDERVCLAAGDDVLGHSLLDAVAVDREDGADDQGEWTAALLREPEQDIEQGAPDRLPDAIGLVGAGQIVRAGTVERVVGPSLEQGAADVAYLVVELLDDHLERILGVTPDVVVIIDRRGQAREQRAGAGRELLVGGGRVGLVGHDRPVQARLPARHRRLVRAHRRARLPAQHHRAQRIAVGLAGHELEVVAPEVEGGLGPGVARRGPALEVLKGQHHRDAVGALGVSMGPGQSQRGEHGERRDGRGDRPHDRRVASGVGHLAPPHSRTTGAAFLPGRAIGLPRGSGARSQRGGAHSFEWLLMKLTTELSMRRAWL